MIKNKQLIKELTNKIITNLELIKAMQTENRIIHNAVHTCMDVMKLLQDELNAPE